MKNLNGLRIMLVSIIGLSLLLTACGRTSKSESIRGTTGTAGIVSTLAETCANGNSAIGVIYDNGTGQFQNQVAAYLSSWMNPAELGAVDGSPNSTTTGVDFKAKLKFTVAGQVDVANTGLEITVKDSYTVQGQPPISMANYDQTAISGSTNTTAKTFTVTFQDTYGKVVMSGQYDANFAWGTVQFQNSKAYTGYTPQSGTLGAFKISKCGLLD